MNVKDLVPDTYFPSHFSFETLLREIEKTSYEGDIHQSKQNFSNVLLEFTRTGF